MFERTPVVLHYDNSGFKTRAEHIIDELPEKMTASDILAKTGLTVQEARKVLNEVGKTLCGRGTSVSGVSYIVMDKEELRRKR